MENQSGGIGFYKTKMSSTEFIALSACSMALTALGIDVMLPALAQVRASFDLPEASTETAKIISFFFMGQVAQLVFGVLSDRFGRLKVLRTGFPLYIIGGFGAAFAPSLHLIYAARFVAGMGASAVFTATIAGVRDRFVGNEMARIMSLILTIFLFTPVIAPFLGSVVLSFSSWQGVFLTPPLTAILVFLWSLRLEESLKPDDRLALKLSVFGRSVKEVLADRTFLRYTLVTTLLFTVLSSYVSSSEHIIGVIYQKPALFPWIFGGMSLFLACCTFINSRLSLKYGAQRLVRWFLSLYTLIGLGLLLLTLVQGDPPDMLLCFIGIGLMLGINLATEPNSSSMAMAPMGHKAGMAASIYGTSFFFFGATAGALISDLLDHHLLPLIASFFLAGLVSYILAKTDTRLQSA